MSPRTILFLAGLLGVMACSDGATRQERRSSPTREGSAVAVVEQAAEETAATEARQPSSVPAVELPEAPAQATANPSALPVEAEVDDEAMAPTPVDIFAVMAEGGFDLESPQDLADYLPVPPRSEGQVGRFVRGEETVTVARVTYPEPVFADPHERWIRERMRLLPDAHERVFRLGATVIHVRADSAATADQVIQLFGGEAEAQTLGDEG